MLWKKADAGEAPAVSNPYLDARREWNAQMGSVAASANNWRLVALFTSVSALAALAGLLALGASRDVVPYVVVLDQNGAMVSSGTPGAQASALDERVVKALVGSFVVGFRTVTFDGTAQRTLIKKLYQQISAADPAYKVLNEYFQRDGDPFARAEHETVSVQPNVILPLSPMTWQVEWTETVRDRSGKVLRQPQFQAQITLRQVEHLNPQQQLDNPLGLFIEDIKWTQKL